MPFRTFSRANGGVKLGESTPDPELRQTADNRFLVLRSFCYLAPRGDPSEGTVYLVPGADFEATPSPSPVADGDGVIVPQDKVVVPPDTGGQTDLASVPSLFWWLIASYGNHTRASLLHDALYVDEGTPVVPRRTADRLFLSALRESPLKAGPFRHWLMWAAVSAFGTMRKLGLLFGAHVVLVWALTIWAVVWAWGDSIGGIDWTKAQVVLGIVAALVFLVVLGSSWRVGVDVRYGWLLPTVLTAAIVFVPLAVEWPSPFDLEYSPFALLLIAAVLTVAGPFWGLAVDPELRGWLWPTAVIGLPLAVVPVVLILAALALVWLIDLGAAIAVSFRTDPSGKKRTFEIPSLGAPRAGS